MNRLIHARVTKSLSYLLVVALVSTIFGATFTTAAFAQTTTPTQTYAVAVVDFVNESRIQGDLLARIATDAVVLEMSKNVRNDVGVTRSQIKAEMEKLNLRPPLERVGLVRLADALTVDAIMQGSIVKIEYSGSGANRTASVTLALQLIDRASGEIINGALQTGSSSARVGYTADDDTLVTEAINNAAYLAVKQVNDYVIPEGTVHVNQGVDQVVLNRGARQGIKLGMRMIVLRQKEIIGFIQVTKLSNNDATAKVLKSLRGIQPEDKFRAIYEMPAVAPSLKGEPLPSGAPATSKPGRSAIQRIGKFLIGAAVVLFVANIFRGGRGTETGPGITTGDTNTVITWDPTKFSHGKNVWQYQILRTDDFAQTSRPVVALTDSAAIDAGRLDLRFLYGTGAATPVTYYTMATNPSTTIPTSVTGSVPAEGFGTQHSYAVRVLYQTSSSAGVLSYEFSSVGGTIKATAIEPVQASDLLQPAYDPSLTAPAILLTELKDGTINFRWNKKQGANAYYVLVEPINPGTVGTFDSRTVGGLIYESGPTVELTAAQRLNLANFLISSSLSTDVVLKWRVFCRNTTDTSPLFTVGEEGRFTVNEVPPNTP